MAIMAGVDYRPINYSGVPKMRSGGPNVVIVHTIVGNDPASAAHFSTRGDGYITQSRDTAYQSAASYQGNPRSIAIENDDHGSEFGNWNVNDGHAVPAFTNAQCESIARICAWAHAVHDIPLQLAADSKTVSAGIAYHRQGIDGNWSGYAYGGRVSGGELWSTSKGKVCPGDRRINQLINAIIPRARVLAGLEEDMGVDWNEKYTHGRTGLNMSYGDWVGETKDTANGAFANTEQLKGMVADLSAQVKALTEAIAARPASSVPQPFEVVIKNPAIGQS
jgi:hypothetical protein